MESIQWSQYSGVNHSIQLKLNSYLFIKVFQQNFVLAEYQNLEPGALTRARANLNLEPGALARARANLNLMPSGRGDVGLIEVNQNSSLELPKTLTPHPLSLLCEGKIVKDK